MELKKEEEKINTFEVEGGGGIFLKLCNGKYTPQT